MELNLLDRAIIERCLLPTFGTRQEILIKNGISNKIALTEKEKSAVLIRDKANGQMELYYEQSEYAIGLMTEVKCYDFTVEELDYLKSRVNHVDQQGMYSSDNIALFDKILDAISDESPSDEQAE